jgi:dolichol-phosphate mannosyltransferase
MPLSSTFTSRSADPSLLSVVFSFRNEEAVLAVLIRHLREVLIQERSRGFISGYELIFVNDASTDCSAQVIAEQVKEQGNADIVLINMARRFGVEEAFLAGIEASRGEVIVLMYTDMQDPPEVIGQMLQCWRQGAEVVHSIRRKRIGEHPLKNAAAFLAYRLIGKLADINIPYDAGEFKLISRKVADHLSKLPEVEPYLRGLIPWIGFQQAYVEYDMHPRKLGRSKVALFGKKAWTVFLSGIISFSDVPIYFILLTGLTGILLALIAGIFLMIFGPMGWFAPVWAFLLFIWATLMFALGVTGLYILKIYKNTRGRPRYIVQEVVRF